MTPTQGANAFDFVTLSTTTQWPAWTRSPSPNPASFPDPDATRSREGDTDSRYLCCGLALADLHELVTHFEEEHMLSDAAESHRLAKQSSPFSSSSTTTSARTPSLTDTTYSGISNYHTGSYQLFEESNAPASPAVEPPFPKMRLRRALDARSRQVLNEVYSRTSFPSAEERKRLAKDLGLSPRKVQLWFQNKRAISRTHPDAAQDVCNAGPSVSAELSQRVQELDNHLAELLCEQDDDCPSGPRAPSTTSKSGANSSGLRATQNAHSWQTVHPTLSSWKKLMTRLATAIDHVEDLVRTASAEHQPSLRAQVVELRDIFTQHQNRYDEFVKLSKEYADQYLHDLSDEIRSQSAWLDSLERRLELAKTLRSAAVDLGASFEKGICKELRGVRAAVRACPLDQEAALFDELDELIGVIKACYVELDKFWTDEVRHVTQALKERRIDQGESQYWRGIGGVLDGVVNDQPQESSAALSVQRLNVMRSQHKLDTPVIASTLISAISSIQASLASARNFRRDFSVLKAKHLRHLEQAFFNVEWNKQRCVRFFGDCVDYARKASASASASAAFSRPNHERAAAMLGLRDKATTLMNDGPIAGSTDMLARVPDSAWKKFSKSFGKIGVMLRDGEGIWRLILDADKCVFAALLRADEDHFIEGRSIKQLKKMLCRIHKDKCTLQRLSMTSW